MKHSKCGTKNMVDTFEQWGKIYPQYLNRGYASRYMLPYLQHLCKGNGVDVGPADPNWTVPNAIAVDPEFTSYHAFKLPKTPSDGWDFIYSSHCLEHIEKWFDALTYWTSVMKKGGTLFLYLPHGDCEIWRPEKHSMHLHAFYPNQLIEAFTKLGYTNIFHSERDLFYSFAIFGEKQGEVIYDRTSNDNHTISKLQ